MKLSTHHFKRRQNGSATLIFIGLLVVMLILLMVNIRTTVRLQREERFIEHRQVERLNSASTNATSKQTQP